jgi:hypothetical protein
MRKNTITTGRLLEQLFGRNSSERFRDAEGHPVKQYETLLLVLRFFYRRARFLISCKQGFEQILEEGVESLILKTD